MKTSSQPNDPEFAATERAYGGATGYAQALAAGRTKLNYQQWIQVRTPTFKAQFGDWEALRAQERIDAMSPIQVRVPDDWRGLDKGDLRKKAVKALREIVESGAPLTNNDIGEVSVSNNTGVGKFKSTSADPAKLYLAADLRSAFQAAVFASSQAPADKALEPNVAAYEKLLARIGIDGSDLVAIFTVQRHADGRQFYNAVTLENGQKKTPAVSPRDTPEQVGERATSANTGVNSFIRQPLRRVNPDSVSKAIDLATGEPLLLYRSADNDLAALSVATKESLLRHRGSSADIENDVERAGSSCAGDAVKLLHDAPNFNGEVTKATTPSSDMAHPVFLNARALDGEMDHIHDGNAWLVLDPAQILSAAGNSHPLGRDDPTTVKANLSAGDQPMANPIQNESTVYGEPKPAAPNDHVDRDTLPDLTQEDAFLANELLVDESPLQAIASPSPVNGRDQAQRDSEKPGLSPTARKRAKKATSDAQPSPAPKEEKPKRVRSTKAKDKAASTPEPAAPQPTPSPAPAPKGVEALDPHAQQRLDRVATNRAADLADAKKKLDADAMNRAKIHLLQDPIGRHIVAVDLGGVTKAYAVDENPGIAAKTVNTLRDGMRKLGGLASEIGFLPDVIKTRFRLKSGEEKIAYNVDPEGVDPRHPHMREAGLGENDRRNLVVIPDGNPDEITKKVLLSTDLPDDVKKRFVYSDTVPGQYFDRSRKLAFIDKGGRLATDQNTPEIIASMISVAQAKGWKAITVKGHEDFQREAWLAASLAGIEVNGFKPKEPDLARLEYERQVRMGNAIQAAAPTPTPVANEISGTALEKQSPEISPEAVALGEVARLKGVREDQIPNFVKAAQAFIDQAKRDGIDLPALKIFDPKAPSAPAVATPNKTREQRSIDNPHPDKAPKR